MYTDTHTDTETHVYTHTDRDAHTCIHTKTNKKLKRHPR